MGTRIESITIACFLLLVSGCGDSSSYPVVIADEEHHIVASRSKDAPEYEIAVSPGIKLDISHFQFLNNGTVFTPDTVQIWDQGKCYRLTRPIGPTMILDASTLTIASGNEVFPGFNFGDHIMINVGRAEPTALTPENMTRDWQGIVFVR